MLVTLANLKIYLGIDPGVTTYDAFLTQQIQIITAAVEGYTGRKFLLANYIQTFYADDYNISPKKITLYHYPLTALTEIKEIIGSQETVMAATEYRAHKPTALVTSNYGLFLTDFQGTTEVKYTAGYAQVDIPLPLQQVVFGLCEEAYNKKKSGIALNFGSDVQRISIPGTISIDFDYTLTANDRKNAFGSILGNYLNIIDPYRSERTVIGGSISYVEVSP